MRHWVVPVIGVLTVACGSSQSGSPTTPGSFSLPDGTYSLVVGRAPSSLCLFSGSGAVTGAELIVSVRSANGGWTISMADSTTGDLAMTLTPQSTQVAGRISGQGSVGGVTTSFEDTAVSGGLDGPSSATGTIEGFVTYTVPSGVTSCMESRWTLGLRR